MLYIFLHGLGSKALGRQRYRYFILQVDADSMSVAVQWIMLEIIGNGMSVAVTYQVMLEMLSHFFL